MRKILLGLALLASAPACVTHLPPPAPAAALPAPVARLVDAFDRHDVDALVAAAHPDIEWWIVDGSSVALETKGADALRASLTSYFANTPSVRSQVEDVVVNGAFVSFRERVRWKKKDGTEATGASIAVYEVEGGLVRRAWYFASQP